MPTFSWAPLPDEVADALAARVPDGFDENTIPTAARVAGMIELAAMEIVGETSTFDPSIVTNPAADAEEQITLGDLARVACTWAAASYIEETYYPEQNHLGDRDDLASHLYRRFRTALDRLVDGIQRNRGQDKVTMLFTGRDRVKDAARWQELIDAGNA